MVSAECICCALHFSFIKVATAVVCIVEKVTETSFGASGVSSPLVVQKESVYTSSSSCWCKRGIPSAGGYDVEHMLRLMFSLILFISVRRYSSIANAMRFKEWVIKGRVEFGQLQLRRTIVEYTSSKRSALEIIVLCRCCRWGPTCLDDCCTL